MHIVTKPSYFRTSHPEVFCNIGVFNFFQNSQGKHLCQSIFNNGLRHRFFPQNFANISKTIFCARVSLIMDFGTDFFLRILQIFQKQFVDRTSPDGCFCFLFDKYFLQDFKNPSFYRCLLKHPTPRRVKINQNVAVTLLTLKQIQLSVVFPRSKKP